jgi:O-antigen/teichoic acid export membrane protein
VTRRGVGATSALALAGDAASKVGALVVVIVAARFLAVPEFATLATGLAAAGVLTAILDFGTGTLLTRDGARSRAARGALFAGSLRARLPLFAAVLFAALLVGALLGRPWAALSVATLGISGALAMSVLGLYRSCQDIRPEALQKLAAAGLSLLAAAGVLAFAPRAEVLLLALATTTLVTLAPLLQRTPSIADLGGHVPRLATLRMAAPIGLLAVATIVYYRSGTIALAALSDPRATAAFGVAAGIAFGLLMVPNAITTALLPRLAAQDDPRGVVDCARRALAWTAAVAVCLSAVSAAVVPALLPMALGPEYADARAPFALLCLGIPLIAASGVIGTALLSIGRLRALATQVAVSLAVNLLVLVLLVPALGAVGASLATVTCEAVGLAVLVVAARSALPGMIALRTYAPRGPIEAPSTALS